MRDFDRLPGREDYLSQLGLVLQMARKAAKITQKKAAERMEMSTAAFTRWEAGQHSISAYDLARLVALYGFDPDLAIDPPTSRSEIRKRLAPVAERARLAVQRAVLRPLPSKREDDGEP